MLRTLRRPLAVLASAVAAATCLIATATPTAAATATTCTQPSVSGAVERDQFTYYNPYTSTTTLRITATGTTTAACAPTRYSTARYRYEVLLESSATQDVLLQSSTVSYNGSSTTIAFPSATFSAPTGAGQMQLTIKSYSYNLYFDQYMLADTRTYKIDVPGSYDTAVLYPTNPYACEPQKPMAWTKWGGCDY